jgi:hypothetical protein
VEALAPVLVVDEVQALVLVAQDLEKELEMVPGLVLAGQDNLRQQSMILTNQWCTDRHSHLKGIHHKCWHHPRRSSSILHLHQMVGKGLVGLGLVQV